MKIYTRRSRVYRNLILGLIWFALMVSKFYSGEQEFGSSHLVYLLAGVIFLVLFYIELTRPYILIANGKLEQGIFIKSSINLKEIKEWQTRSGVLILSGDNAQVRIFPNRISQKDMEQIYELLKADKSPEEQEFRMNNDL
ncbi:MAG: DUF986 family protein [Bacteroidetes bacterium]|nr:DUF986 family protein [Bacteroidota bacterium]